MLFFWIIVPSMIVKRIKTRPDGPGQMGLTDPCPWAEKRQGRLLYRSTVNKTLRENKDPMKIKPKRWETLEGERLNRGFLYGGMTCPSRLGFLKKTPIRKGLGLQGKEVNLRLL